MFASSGLRYLVPRKRCRGLLLCALLLLVVTATTVLLQELAIVYVWASTARKTTQQLEALIPRENSILKVAQLILFA